MKRIIKIIVVFILYCYSSVAQLADQITHDQFADSIKQLLNSKQFVKIYQLTNPDFKAEITEKEIINYLENSIYFSFGKVESINFLSLNEDANYYSYVLNFKSDKIQMNLGVNEFKQISYLKIVPYKERFLTKRHTYSSDNKKQTQLDTLVDETLKSFMQSPQNCGISLAVSQNGREFFYNYGEVKRDSKILPSQSTIYEIGSLTKTFCGILLANALVENKIKLDDDIRKFFRGKYPNLVFNKKPILVKYLANHTSALPRIPENMIDQSDFDTLNPYKNYNRQQFFTYLKSIELTNEPGTEFDYSNFGMALLGIILETVYEKSFEELIKEKITLPNKMINTTSHLTEEQTTRFAEGYNSEGKSTPHWNFSALSAAGALHSTSRDMLTYLNYNMLEQDSVTKLAHKVTYSGREKVALSWFKKKTKQGSTLVWHDGGTFGFSSFAGYLEGEKSAVVILANSGTNVEYIAIAILNFLQL